MKQKHTQTLSTLVKILIGVLYGLPVILAVLFSFHTNEDLTTLPLKVFTIPSLENFVYVFENVPFLTYLKNTVIMLIIIIPVQIFFASLVAFAFSFFEFPLKKTLFTVFLMGMMIPAEVNIIANYMTIQNLNLMDNYLGMTIVSFVSISGMFMLRQHMLAMPPSMWEAARMDGCKEMRYYFSFILPLSKSIIFAQVITSFISVYNAYLWPLMVTSSEDMRTVQTGIANLVRDMYWNPGGALAGAVVCMLIPIVIYVWGTERIVGGLTSGAVK